MKKYLSLLGLCMSVFSLRALEVGDGEVDRFLWRAWLNPEEVDALDKWGNPPLYDAFSHSRPSFAVQVLLNAGANPNLPSIHLYKKTFMRNKQLVTIPLLVALFNKGTDIPQEDLVSIIKAFIEHGADVNTTKQIFEISNDQLVEKYDGYMPPLIAAYELDYRNQTDKARACAVALIQGGADVDRALEEECGENAAPDDEEVDRERAFFEQARRLAAQNP